MVLPRDPRPNVQVTLEVSSDLVNWHSDAANVEVYDVINNGDGTESHLFRVLGDIATARAVFHRLRVVEVP